MTVEDRRVRSGREPTAPSSLKNRFIRVPIQFKNQSLKNAPAGAFCYLREINIINFASSIACVIARADAFEPEAISPFSLWLLLSFHEEQS